MRDIINIQSYADALRNTGYEDTESALAEIVDNSIEAGAKNIFIICSLAASGRKRITEIAILDNGHGMNKKLLAGSLSIGEGTRKDRKGMGRFGVGLPQASLHVSPSIEVYSWQAKNKSSVAYLDVEKIKSGKQKKIETKEKNLPSKYNRYLNLKNFKGMPINSFEKSGALVVWKNCDRLQPSGVASLFKRFERLLGRKFRHYITKGHSIALMVTSTAEHDSLILPNDPLYLMKNNSLLGNSEKPSEVISDGKGGEPIFQLWEKKGILGKIKHPVLYSDPKGKIKKSKVEITFSIAKKPYHDAGGESKLGKAIKENVGISIVRADREIDFGKFDFFEDVNQPQHRWWGCEIKFTPELDEAFGVANNKQQVKLYYLESSDYDEEEARPMWLQLCKTVHDEIGSMYKALRKGKEGSRKKKKSFISPEESTVAGKEKGNEGLTRSAKVKEESDPKDLKKQVRERLAKTGIPDPSEEEVKKVMEVPVRLEFDDIGGSAFIDVSTVMGNCWLTINTGSLFYQELYSHIDQQQDERIKSAFNLLLMAYARAEDETPKNTKLYESFKDVREIWSHKVRKYLESDYLS